MATEFETENSALKVSGKNIVYSLLKAGDGFNEIRIYNDSDNTDTAKIEFADNIIKAELVNLDGKVKQELIIENNSVSLELDKWKIATIRYILA